MARHRVRRKAKRSKGSAVSREIRKCRAEGIKQSVCVAKSISIVSRMSGRRR